MNVLEEQDKLWKQHLEAGRKLKALSGGGSLGLTPDKVKASSEWQVASKEYAIATSILQNFNVRHAKEIKAARKNKVRLV